MKKRDKLVETAEVIKDEYESLKDGMEVVTAEITKMSKKKVLLKEYGALRKCFSTQCFWLRNVSLE